MSRDYRLALPEIDAKINAEITNLLGTVDDARRAEILSRIRARRDKLSLSSDITDHVLSVCGTLLGFGAAGLGLSVGFADKIRQFDPLVQKVIVAVGIVYLELALVSLIVLLLYMLQARFRYPFLYFGKIGNTWPWFYYASISPAVSRRSIQTRGELLAAAQHYASDFVAFSKKAADETPADELRNELQQYYLLIAYQGYVHQFSLRLANLFFYGLIASIASGMFLAFLVLYS
jgi:hypothetical protein